MSRRAGRPEPTELAAMALAGYSLLSSLGWAALIVAMFIGDDRSRSDDDLAILVVSLVVPLVVALLGVLAWVRRRRWPVLASPPFALVFAPLAYHCLNTLMRHTEPLSLFWAVVLAVSGVLDAAAVVLLLYLAGTTVAARSGLPGQGPKVAP